MWGQTIRDKRNLPLSCVIAFDVINHLGYIIMHRSTLHNVSNFGKHYSSFVKYFRNRDGGNFDRNKGNK